MKNAVIWTLGFCFAAGVIPNPGLPSQIRPENDIDLKDLAPAYNLDGRLKPFKSVPYMRAAALLQKLGKDEAYKKLATLADKDDEGKVALLCRLLFSKKARGEFRPPRLGDPKCLDGTKCDDWPLLPFTLVDAVPFYVVRIYRLSSEPEPSSSYLKYCIANCEWSKTRFDRVVEETLETALQKILASDKWKKPMTDSERQFLSSQIK